MAGVGPGRSFIRKLFIEARAAMETRAGRLRPLRRRERHARDRRRHDLQPFWKLAFLQLGGFTVGGRTRDRGDGCRGSGSRCFHEGRAKPQERLIADCRLSQDHMARKVKNLQTVPCARARRHVPAPRSVVLRHQRRRRQRRRRQRRRHCASAGVAVVVSTMLDRPTALRTLETPAAPRTWPPTLLTAYVASAATNAKLRMRNDRALETAAGMGSPCHFSKCKINVKKSPCRAPLIRS